MKQELLKRLFQAIATEDKMTIQNMLSIVVEEERKKGDIIFAEQLQSIIRKSSHQLHQTSSKTPDTKSLTLLTSKQRFNYPFIETVPREHLRHHMIVSSPIEQRFCQIEKEYVARDRLAHHGLRYRQKILLYGSPGCGKTMGAERLAWNTGLTFVKVRFDAMISSSLEETATNLREVFKTVSQTPCLLFINECNAIAKSQENVQEVGEIKRVVNTFLQLLDEYETSNGLLIATTNMTKFLNEAVWGRFDDVIKVPKPTTIEIEEILKQTLSSVEVGIIDWKTIALKLDNFSAAQVIRVAQDAAKRTILNGKEILTQEYLEVSIQDLIISHV